MCLTEEAKKTEVKGNSSSESLRWGEGASYIANTAVAGWNPASGESSIGRAMEILGPLVPAARNCAGVKVRASSGERSDPFGEGGFKSHMSLATLAMLGPLVPCTRVTGVVKARVTSTQ